MIKLLLLVPRKNFIDVAFKTFEEHNKIEKLYNGEAYQMEEMIVTEKNINNLKINADVIITRGLLAEILQSVQGDIPVVEVPVPATDIIRTINACIQKFGSKKIGAIAAHNMVIGASELSDFIITPVQSYVLGKNWNGPDLVNRAVKDGCEVIIGGLKTCHYASLINVDNMIIKTSKESFWQSLTAAKRAAQISRKEQEKSSRIKVILDTSSEGFISIDMKKKIHTINQRAEAILKVDRSLQDSRVQDAPFPLEFKNMLITNYEFTNKLYKYKDSMLNVSKSFIKVKNSIVGTIINFQEVNGIQDLESKIRKTIYNKGHVAKKTFDDIVGDSGIMKNAVETAKKFSRTDSNVLLIGESGTGKEIFSQSIHNYSLRSGGPFVAVNCAAIPDNLLESELFGYTSGAFTGAQKSGKPGFFELAHKGTIFLDEIGEIPLSLQAKLLRVIQEKEIIRLGGNSVIPVDIRVIAATNQNLEEHVQRKTFREDLFFRLDVLRINIPSLNERRQDIPLLVENYMSCNFPSTQITQEAKQALCYFNWYGNVRHLFNICERLAVLKESNIITLKDVQVILGSHSPVSTVTKSRYQNSNSNYATEKLKIVNALELYKYNRTETAKYLKIDRSTLWRKMKEYKL